MVAAPADKVTGQRCLEPSEGEGLASFPVVSHRVGGTLCLGWKRVDQWTSTEGEIEAAHAGLAQEEKRVKSDSGSTAVQCFRQNDQEHKDEK